VHLCILPQLTINFFVLTWFKHGNEQNLMFDFQLWKCEQQRLYKQQYRVKKRAISRIERERALGLATPQTMPVVAVPENLLDQQVYDVDAGVNVSNLPMLGEGNLVQEVFEVEWEDVIEDEFEIWEPIEEGGLAHSWLSVGVNGQSGDFDTECHTDKESDSESIGVFRSKLKTALFQSAFSC
jgi:hypothetical protein